MTHLTTQWSASFVGKCVKKANRNVRRTVRSAKSVAKTTTLQQNVEQTRNKERKNVHNIVQCESEEYEDILCVTEAETENVDAVDTDKVNDPQLFAGMLLDKDVVKFQIDCGATCNIIPINLLNPDTKLERTECTSYVQQKQTDATGEM